MQSKSLIAAAALALLALSATAEAHRWPRRLHAPAASRALFRRHSSAETKGPPRAAAAIGRRAIVVALASVVLALPGCGSGERSERSGALSALFFDLLGIPGLQVGPAARSAEPGPPSAAATADIGAEAFAPAGRQRGARRRL